MSTYSEKVASLRRKVALWICPDLEPKAVPAPSEDELIQRGMDALQRAMGEARYADALPFTKLLRHWEQFEYRGRPLPSLSLAQQPIPQAMSVDALAVDHALASMRCGFPVPDLEPPAPEIRSGGGGDFGGGGASGSWGGDSDSGMPSSGGD